MDAFERVAFFDCKAGEDDPKIMDMFNAEKRHAHKKKCITANDIRWCIIIVFLAALLFCIIFAPIVYSR